MKAKALSRFMDLKEGTIREVGDEFILSKERFEEITALGEFIEEILEPEEKPEKKKKGKGKA